MTFEPCQSNLFWRFRFGHGFNPPLNCIHNVGQPLAGLRVLLGGDALWSRLITCTAAHVSDSVRHASYTAEPSATSVDGVDSLAFDFPEFSISSHSPHAEPGISDFVDVVFGKGSVRDLLADIDQRMCVRFEGSTTRLGQGNVWVAVLPSAHSNRHGVRWHIPVFVQNDADFCAPPNFEYGYAEPWSAP
jgi:hypothetical protein